MELTEQNISNMLEDIPTFSQSVVRILELTGDINSSTKELVKQITHDPILTAKVLKLVNSAYFGLSREVSSIQQSVVYVGINTIKNLALSVAAIGALPRTNQAGLDMNHFWLHSLMTACIAKLLAQKRGVPQVEISPYFISGLLHDIGQIIFSQGEPERYREVLTESRKQERPLCELEEEMFGINHAGIGALLAEKWQLPKEVVFAIRHHHNHDCPDGDQELINTVFVANQITKSMEDETTRVSMVDYVPESILEWLGQPLDEAATSLDNFEEEIENAWVFIQLTG